MPRDESICEMPNARSTACTCDRFMGNVGSGYHRSPHLREIAIYIIVSTDYFSKWPEAAALPNKNAISVATFLYSLYCRFGAGDIVTARSGKRICEYLCKSLRVLGRDSVCAI